MISLLSPILLVCAPLVGCDDPAPSKGDTSGAANADSAADTAPLTPNTADASLTPLPAPELLRRMSLDLRGALPSTAQLDAVEAAADAEAQAAALAAAREEILADPLLGERLVILLGERWHTRVDAFLIGYTEYPALAQDSQAEYRFERSVGEEPLRLMAQIAVQDRPWSEIVTADYTVGNDTLASIWPMDCDPGSGWRACRYTDDRPAAGVLSTNGLWWRYYSTVSNYNRGRAAAVSRLLLCEDILSRPVSFAQGVALVDAGGVEEALRQDPYCMGCHSGLDPAFAGAPVQDLADLGQQIAADPRFTRCAAESFAEQLWRREITAADFDRIEGLRRAFEAGDGTIKPLLRAVTDTAVYRAGIQADPAGASEPTRRLMDLSLLASALRALTGFTWTLRGDDMLDSDTYGFRILGGGVDGDQVTRPQRSPGMTWIVTAQRVAEAFGDTVGQQVGSGLLAGVSAADTPGSAAFDAKLRELHWRLYARRADDTWVTDIGALWSRVAAREGPRAWGAVVSAMIQDPMFLTY